MELKLGDVQTTALIPLAVKANETMRDNARIRDDKAVEIIKALGIDTEQYDKFMSHEGVIARTIMLDKQLKKMIRKEPDMVIVNIGAGFDNRFSRVDNGSSGCHYCPEEGISRAGESDHDSRQCTRGRVVCRSKGGGLRQRKQTGISCRGSFHVFHHGSDKGLSYRAEE